MLDRSVKKGNPVVVSETKGEDITPENPEVVQQFPVESATNDPAVETTDNETNPVVSAVKNVLGKSKQSPAKSETNNAAESTTDDFSSSVNVRNPEEDGVRITTHEKKKK